MFKLRVISWKDFAKCVFIAVALFSCGYWALVFCFFIIKWCFSGIYLTGVVMLVSVPLYFILTHKKRVNMIRLEDVSEINALITDAKGFLQGSDISQHCRKKLESEIARLENMGSDKWTEYETLSLDQILVDCWPDASLRSKSQSILIDLKEYTMDGMDYEKELYSSHEKNINDFLKNIELTPGVKNPHKDSQLRAELKTIIETITDYSANWSGGTALLNSLKLSLCLCIPILLVMALLPLCFYIAECSLWFSWALLGMVGAFLVVLLDLRRSNAVDVGDQQGRRELWRVILGAILGLVAGIVSLAFIKAGLVSGPLVPNFIDAKYCWENMALTIIWGIGSGFGYEIVFDKVRSVTVSSLN